MKRKKSIFYIVTIVTIIFGMILSYFLIFAQLKISIGSVTVSKLPYHFSEGKETPEDVQMSIVSGLLEDARENKYPEMQAFWSDKPLPSDDPNDYAVISFNLNVKNTTIFTAESPYLLMNEYDESSEILVVNQPHPTYYQFDRMSSSKSVFQYSVYAYIAGKSEDEIRSLISSIELQIPYSSKIKKNGNMTFSVSEKYDIKYEGF